jgi:hypothetical protein
MSDPLQWSQALEAEVASLRGGPVLGPEAPVDPDARAQALYREIHKHPPSALCLSGGGIRSGTFALGVLQGLAHLGLLGQFDYLSTVSGGGYIGGWFSALLHRRGPERRDETLRSLDPAQAKAITGSIDAPSVDYVRRTCQYLAPSGSTASADFWTVLSTLIRNLLLNWMVILPLLAAALLLPRLFYTLTHTFEAAPTSYAGLQCLAKSPASSVFLAIALVGFAVASGFVAAVFSGIGRNWTQQQFLFWFLGPLLTGAIACALFWSAFPCSLEPAGMLGVSAMVPAIGWAVVGIWARGIRHRQPDSQNPRRVIGLRTVFAAAASGLVLGAGAYGFATFEYGFNIEEAVLFQYGALAVPIVLALVLLSITMFVGLASEELDDAALEWWSRCAAWIGMATLLWLVASVIVLYMADGLETALSALESSSLHLNRRVSTGIVAALVPLFGSLAGMAARSTGASDKPSAFRLTVQKLALPLMILALFTTVAWVNLRAAEALEYHRDSKHVRCGTKVAEVEPMVSAVDPLAIAPQGAARASRDDGDCHPMGAGFGEVVILGLGYLVFGLGMSFFVPANRFSLHGMYQQRLVRTFLGASRDDRKPNPFTGFDGRDDLRVHDLADVRPLHVMNATLNAVSSTRVAGHERQAESFTFSPLHVGNRNGGYRPAHEYGSDGGAPGTGLSLGMAMAVSGAAASPAMGIYSSKARAFLLTLANARLGLWFGNPTDDKSWQNSEPPLGVGPILRELLGLTTDRNPFVYLSDGGHYENLGLWEMVSRRCGFIVVSDAGCDPEYGFADLSNAIRRIRLDLGIPIQFPPLDITTAGQGHGNPHVAIGTIRYSVIDGADAPDGTILYLKATLSGDEPVDVWNFALTNPAFPHDPTSEQFFDETRFESYRTLGFHTMITAAPGFAAGQTLTELFQSARTTLDDRAAVRST